MQTLKADFDFFLNYRQKPKIYKSAWMYKWRFFRYFITRAGLFFLGLRLGAPLNLCHACRLYSSFFTIFFGDPIFRPMLNWGQAYIFRIPLAL